MKVLIETLARSQYTSDSFDAFMDLLLDAIAIETDEATGTIQRVQIVVGESAIVLENNQILFYQQERVFSFEQISAALILLESLKDLLPESTDGSDDAIANLEEAG